jgi:hypothetical protein
MRGFCAPAQIATPRSFAQQKQGHFAQDDKKASFTFHVSKEQRFRVSGKSNNKGIIPRLAAQ